MSKKHCFHTQIRDGFTLIELLIVVGIIAILAAIAVPNFLEAQVRSKVTRVMADMRTMSTALEAYITDHGRYPPGYYYCTNVMGIPNNDPRVVPWTTRFLTTPIAYLSSPLPDPFYYTSEQAARDELLHYLDFRPEYTGFGHTAHARGFLYTIKSPGPRRLHGGWASGLTNNVSDVVAYISRGEPPAYLSFVYDPTNGTRSYGWIQRTNKGPLTGPQ